jgi:hypothetical protein
MVSGNPQPFIVDSFPRKATLVFFKKDGIKLPVTLQNLQNFLFPRNRQASLAPASGVE